MNDAEIAAGLAPTPGYRYADRVGDELYVAGQVPLDAAGELVGIGDVTAQSHQCLHNLDLVLHTSGFGRADLRRLSIHVVGEHQNLISAWQAMHEAFDGEVPRPRSWARLVSATPTSWSRSTPSCVALPAAS